MCTDMKITNQLSKDKRKTKYELGNFCQQYGLSSIGPSKRYKIKEKIRNKNFGDHKYYKNKPYTYRNNKFNKSSPEKFYKSNKHRSRKDSKDKTKVKCFKCNKFGHFANECKVKQTIKQLNIP